MAGYFTKQGYRYAGEGIQELNLHRAWSGCGDEEAGQDYLNR